MGTDHFEQARPIMDSNILRQSWKIKLFAAIFGVVMSFSVYVVYAAGLKFNHLAERVGEIARQNVEDRLAAEAAAREEANRKAGIVTTHIYDDKKKDN